ncbi:MAG TPA: hypothetical protein PKH24_20420 [Sedimentisphaerales bacterium]|nr:hypothetical protein [Sedimentisphaerales bacterium]HNU31560.1 hypothetical protein [Sedimentisphaerales bacterium]
MAQTRCHRIVERFGLRRDHPLAKRDPFCSLCSPLAVIPLLHWAGQDIEERVRFLAAIDKGLADIRSGKVVAHEEVKESLREWLSR